MKQFLPCIIGLALALWPGTAPAAPRPNILFVIMDDVGIDQMTLFGFGGAETGPQAPPKTPALDALAASGVMFSNTWASPECSPSRVSFFTGRYPLRHNVFAAILPKDLAASQLSPFETTTPAILRRAGYTSALFGKAHFTNSPTYPQVPSTDPYQGTAVTQLGWDYFKGWHDGGPNEVDTTAGGVAPAGTYSCGYVPPLAQDPVNGADSGACYQPDGSCRVLGGGLPGGPGLACLASGGILKPRSSCGSLPPGIDFHRQNGYYAGELAENPGPGRPGVVKDPADPESRGYRTTLEADFAIDWIRAQPRNKPWMATLAFAAAHTPYQPAPPALLSDPAKAGGNCTGTPTDSRALMSQMVEGLDRELARVLVETGIASRRVDGSIRFDFRESNTVVVVIGDNGSFANNVRLPFDPAHSKGTVYQTGVWVPLIIAGPMVAAPNRTVSAMVNAVDLFKLFGELAGIDVRKAVPGTHGLDARPLLPYLLNPRQEAIRATNFAQYGTNLRPASHVNGTCIIASINTCTTLFPNRELCENGNGGIWYGKGTAEDIPEPYKSGNGLTSCCMVNQYLHAESRPLAALLPDTAYAVRNRDYKLIRQTATDIDPDHPALGEDCITRTTDEFYAVDETAPDPQLDRPSGASANNLLPPGTGPGGGSSHLTGPEKSAYEALTASLAATLYSQKDCPGDANLDARVNAKDLRDQATWMRITGNASTWWDMNQDGYTNRSDRQSLLSLSMTDDCKLKPGQSR